MKLFYRLSHSLIHIIIGGTLLLAGVSCSSGDDEYAMAPDSDILSPTGNYTINGKVVSNTNQGQGIPNIQIGIHIEKNNPVADTLYTDPNGRFEWTGAITTFGDNAKLNISAADTTNKYKAYKISIEFTKNDMNESTNVWFLGEGKKDLLIKLEENPN